MVRGALVEAARRQIASAREGDISTRAVCDEAGVTQPVLYRLFGDKNGLLDAVADDAFERYARRKQALEISDDPVKDLHTGWRDHMSFAAENPAVYQLMFVPRPHSASNAYRRILELLEATLLRCAATGTLATTPRLAAQLILPANIGVALSHIAQPHLFDDPALSDRTREAIFAAVLSRPADPGPPSRTSPMRTAAWQLRAQLTLTGTDKLAPVEAALLDHWLERLDETP
ncbi:TetR family transcriptional regulator [Actinoplanes couchii]|uniref:TetR family transcriptional regulator n=2 Tax=Actinoplanes couchii TaxID=403638 RepID=A0ABQ3XRX8_9ACTN|nr:TetR family transcriptional regulator [Actinoplanes couchii]